MTTSRDDAGEIRRLLLARAPLYCRDRTIHDDLPLGSGGLGLDSLTLVEIVVACEERFEVTLSASLFANGPVTIATLVQCIEEMRARRRPER